MRRGVFPQILLAPRFGPRDGDYAWRIFAGHRERLERAGFASADRILEVGPGQNLGTALLWWAYSSTRKIGSVSVTCWDIFRNADPGRPGFWNCMAVELLRTQSLASFAPTELTAKLEQVADGQLKPDIAYQVCSLKRLENLVAESGGLFDLIYSQAAVEHIWEIDTFWDVVERMTRPGGWQSHRIDLADHGYRETNYVEMLEWSRVAYWMTMRFVPGACNRWRAVQHLAKLEQLGLEILEARRELQPQLPISLSRISAEFRYMDATELRCTALDVVLRKSSQC